MIPKKFDTIIYHKNCYDGITSAWAARKHSPDAEFIPASYGYEPPDVKGKTVLIVDFSYPRDVLESMNNDAETLLVLDHHKTAAADLEGLDYAIFDMERSGAGLAWDYLHPDEPRPPLITLVEDRDLWRFKHSETKNYHAAMTARPMTFESLDELSCMDMEDIVLSGMLIQKFSELMGSKFALRAGHLLMDGQEFWVVNCPVEFVGETADILTKREPELPVLCWSWGGKSNNYYCSVRSGPNGMDVSAIARKYGGGGHEHASGFRLDTPPPSRGEVTPLDDG